MKNNAIDTTKLSCIQKFLDSMKKYWAEGDDPDIPFETLIGSCYPTIWWNIQEKLKEEYAAGFSEGVNSVFLEQSENLTYLN